MIFLVLFLCMLVQHSKMFDQLQQIDTNVQSLVDGNQNYYDDGSVESALMTASPMEKLLFWRLEQLQNDVSNLNLELRVLREQQHQRHSYRHHHEGTGAENNYPEPPQRQQPTIAGYYAMSVSQELESDINNAVVVNFTDSALMGSSDDFTPKLLQGFALRVVDANGNTETNLQLKYMAHVGWVGDSPVVSQGNWVQIDTIPRSTPNALQGISVTLTGDWASKYDVKYKVITRTQPGPSVAAASDVCKNGEFCGTRDEFRSIVGMKVWLEKL